MAWLNAHDTFLMDVLARARLDELLATAELTVAAGEKDEPTLAGSGPPRPEYAPCLLQARACSGACG